MPVVDLWPTLEERNAFVPPSRARLPEEPAALDPLLRRLTERFAEDYPGPLPDYDPASGRAAAALVAAALARLDPGNPPGRRLPELAAALPAPQTAAAHSTQAALLWHAVPLARRLLSHAFRSGTDPAEAAGNLLRDTLAARPLLSFRADSEETFAHAPPPRLDSLQGGGRRWLLQRLASPTANAAVLSRRAAALRQLEDVDLRGLLVLGPPEALLPCFDGLRRRGQWPEDLAPELRAKGSHEH